MERLTQRYEMLKKSLNSLQEILERIKPLSKADNNYLPFRDSTIQRFEYSVDTFWKFLKEYLEKKYGITTVNSPKAVIKTATEVSIISKANFPLFIAIIDDRNMTSHTYNEELAEEIYANIPKYYTHLSKVFQELKI